VTAGGAQERIVVSFVLNGEPVRVEAAGGRRCSRRRASGSS